MSNEAVDHLVRLQSDDGGFGAYPGGESRTEATALAALALGRADGLEDGGPAAAGLSWLESHQLMSGAWPLTPSLNEAHWSTSLAVLALTAGGRTETVEPGARWLLEEKGRGAAWWVTFILKFSRREKTVDLDQDLIGWPWASGTFSWVEPTSYAMFALKRLRDSWPDERLEVRVREGDRLLANRSCPGGGWNYGNTRVFEEDLWPYPDTTSVALLALSDRADLPQVADGLDVLPGLLSENGSILSLALGSLALEAHGRDATEAQDQLAVAVSAWESGEVRALAWAALALANGADVLRGAGV